MQYYALNPNKLMLKYRFSGKTDKCIFWNFNKYTQA